MKSKKLKQVNTMKLNKDCILLCEEYGRLQCMHEYGLENQIWTYDYIAGILFNLGLIDNTLELNDRETAWNKIQEIYLEFIYPTITNVKKK